MVSIASMMYSVAMEQFNVGYGTIVVFHKLASDLVCALKRSEMMGMKTGNTGQSRRSRY